MKSLALSRAVAVGLSCAGGALLAGDAANAITDTVFKYTTAKTGYLSIPAAAFAPTQLANDYDNDGIRISPATTNRTCFIAPVNLPQGAKLTALAVWYIMPAGTLQVSFLRQKLADTVPSDIVNQMLPVAPSRKLANYAITDAAVQTVDNQRYVYLMVVCMNMSLTVAFDSARVAYTYTQAGD